MSSTFINADARNAPEVLVVDDSPVVRKLLTQAIQFEFTVHQAKDGAQAWDILENNANISLIFTDMQMPGINGLKLLHMIRNSESKHIAQIPVIVVTGMEDIENTKRAAYSMGVTDFITKPFDAMEVTSKARTYSRLHSRSQSTHEHIEVAKDTLTNLYNLNAYRERGTETMAFSNRHKTEFSVMIAEIMNFDDIAKKHGKMISDQVAAKLAEQIRKSFRIEDVAARIDKAKFSVLMPMTTMVRAYTSINRLTEKVSKLIFDTGRERFKIKLMIGVANLTPECRTFDDVFSNAENSLQSSIIRENNRMARSMEMYQQQSGTHGVESKEVWESLTSMLEKTYGSMTLEEKLNLTPRFKETINFVETGEFMINTTPKKAG